MDARAGFEGEVFLEDLRDLDRTGFAACAFFTPDGRLERCARRFAASCERLGVPYSVWRAAAVHPSISTRGTGDLRFTKPSFIAANLDRLSGSDVAYFDVDTLLVATPLSLVEARMSECDFAIYNWLADPRNETYLPANRKIRSAERESEFYVFAHRVTWLSTEQLICSGATQYYANTAAARELLAAWQAAIAAKPRSADDKCLDFAHNNAIARGMRLRSLWLGKAYARCPWWPHVEPVVLHPGIPALTQAHAPVDESSGRRRVDTARCAPNETPLLFPRDCAVDTRTGIVYRIAADNRLVEVDRYAGRFWIYAEEAGLDEALAGSRPRDGDPAPGERRPGEAHGRPGFLGRLLGRVRVAHGRHGRMRD
jgi:hypothetical protein